MSILIWDYNGTILDDTELCLDIENSMLEERGLKSGYTLAEYRDLFMFPVQDYYRQLGYTFVRESYEAVAHEFNSLYDTRFDECGLVEGFLEKIDEATAKGYTNVIISACEQNVLREQVKRLGIADRFAEIIGVDDRLASSKVDIARTWMQRSRIRAADCCFIGDTLHDLETAMGMGIENYTLVACGHQSYQKMRQATDRVVHSMKEVCL